MRVELYNSYDDDVRLFMEIVLSLMIFGMMVYTFYLIAMTQKVRRGTSWAVRPGGSTSRASTVACSVGGWAVRCMG